MIAGGICESSIQLDFGDGGSGITFVETLDESEQYGADFFRKAGIRSLEQTRAMNADALMDQVRRVGLASPMKHLMFSVSVDGDFLREPLHSACYNGRIPDVPMMVGICRDELDQIFPRRPASMELLKLQAQRYSDRADEFLAITGAHTDQGADAVLNGPGFNPFYAWTRAFCDLRAGAGKPVYFFLFNQDMPGDSMGSSHSSELPFVFDNLDCCRWPFEGRHYDLARQAASYWANFVRNGDSNGEDTNHQPLPAWEPYRSDARRFMRFSDTARPETLPETPVLDFRLDFGRNFYADND